MYCGRDLGSFMVKNAPTVCKFCGSKFIAFGKDIKGDIEKLRDIASLYLSHGKFALYCFAGYGIGLKTAKRILKDYKDEWDLIRKIVEEERRFIRTRRFWKS